MGELICIDERFKELYKDYIHDYMELLNELDSRPSSIFVNQVDIMQETRSKYMKTLIGTLQKLNKLDSKYKTLLELHEELTTTTWITIVINRVRLLHDHLRKCVTAQHHAIQEVGKMKRTWERSYITSREYIRTHLSDNGKC